MTTTERAGISFGVVERLKGMGTTATIGLRQLEGRQVAIALRGGDRIDACQLVSAGRTRVGTVWVFTGGTDVFVPVADILDVWEVAAAA